MVLQVAVTHGFQHEFEMVPKVQNNLCWSQEATEWIGWSDGVTWLIVIVPRQRVSSLQYPSLDNVVKRRLLTEYGHPDTVVRRKTTYNKYPHPAVELVPAIHTPGDEELLLSCLLFPDVGQALEL